MNMLGSNLAYVPTKNAFIGGVDALVTKEAMAGEVLDAESDASGRPHDRQLGRLSMKSDNGILFGFLVVHLQCDSTSLTTGGQYLSLGL
jgi:hypothetical protein